jgi:hypothetical protein
MAHHKRKRPKTARAGCLMCKPWKHQRVGKHRNLRLMDKRAAESARQQMREAA